MFRNKSNSRYIALTLIALFGLLIFGCNPTPGEIEAEEYAGFDHVYVAVGGSDSNSCTSPATPCATLSGALNKVVHGGTVEFAAGTYRVHGDEPGTPLEIRHPASIPGHTPQVEIIGAGAESTIFEFQGGEGISLRSWDIRFEGIGFHVNDGPGNLASGIRLVRNFEEDPIVGNNTYAGTYLFHSEFRDCHIFGSGNGVGVYVERATGGVKLRDVVIENFSTGIETGWLIGEMYMRVKVSNNDTGIDVRPGAFITLKQSEISDNNQNGGLVVGTRGGAEVIKSLITRNIGVEGSGILVEEGAELILIQSTVSENHVSGSFGAAVNLKVDSQLSMDNSTISGNTFESSGVALHFRGSEGLIEFSTIARNNGEGMWVRELLEIKDTIIGENDGVNCRGASADDILFRGINMSNDDTCGPDILLHVVEEIGLEPIPVRSPRVSPFSWYPPFPHPLLSSSPAIDVINAEDCLIGHIYDAERDRHYIAEEYGIRRVDQRGQLRPQGLGCDIGAFEANDIRGSVSPPPFFTEPLVSPTPFLDPIPIVIALQNASCRRGADPTFDVLNFLYKDQTALVIGRISQATWFYVELPDELGRCWIFAENLELSSPLEQIPLFTPPELPASIDEGGGADDGGGGEGQQDETPDDPEGPEDCAPDEYWSIATQSCEPFG